MLGKPSSVKCFFPWLRMPSGYARGLEDSRRMPYGSFALRLRFLRIESGRHQPAAAFVQSWVSRVSSAIAHEGPFPVHPFVDVVQRVGAETDVGVAGAHIVGMDRRAR